MDESAKRRLDEMLGKYEDRRVRLQEQREAAEKEQAAARVEAENYIATVVKPVMAAFAEHLNAQGHEAAVLLEGQGCRLRLFPKGAETHGADRPFIKFSAGKDQVSVDASNILPGRGGSAGGRGTYSRQDFTQEVMESEILKWVDEVLFGPWR